MHYCYILYNTSNLKTYVGYTTNPFRRLRQHNGHLVGGARYTKQSKGTWSFLAVITSPNFTNNLALSLEWYIKYNSRKIFSTCKGARGRITSLISILKLNDKFNDKDMEYHLYMSKYGQSIITNDMMTDLSHLDNILLYDELDDITTAYKNG